jgi:hypothetical protein
MPNGKIPTIVVTGTGPKDERELSMFFSIAKMKKQRLS